MDLTENKFKKLKSYLRLGSAKLASRDPTSLHVFSDALLYCKAEHTDY